jgi:hypothetical protein
MQDCSDVGKVLPDFSGKRFYVVVWKRDIRATLSQTSDRALSHSLIVGYTCGRHFRIDGIRLPTVDGKGAGLAGIRRSDLERVCRSGPGTVLLAFLDAEWNAISVRVRNNRLAFGRIHEFPHSGMTTAGSSQHNKC